MPARGNLISNGFCMSTTQTPIPLLIEPETLQALGAQAKLLIIDLTNEADYFKGHIPSAVFLPYQALLAGTPPATGDLPPIEQLNQVFGYLGLTPDTHVVAYDDEGGGWAGRLLWTLDVIGHKTYSYLNGGIHAWRAAGLELETGNNSPASCLVKCQINEEPIATQAYIMQKLDDTQSIVWDARSPEEYAGLRSGSARAGHIPSAVNYEWTRAMNPERALRVRDLEAVRAELAALGITGDKEIITHCQTHHRSGFTYLLAKLLAFEKIKAYPGSWSEWGNDPNTPIE